MSEVSINIVKFVKEKQGHKEGNGECWTLAENALKSAGAKTSRDYGKVTPNANYKWGKKITKREIRPGDVIQFRNYKVKEKTEIKVVVKQEFPGEKPRREEAVGTPGIMILSYPHHTALAASSINQGAIKIYHQNFLFIKKVKIDSLILSNMKKTPIVKTEKIPFGTKTTTTTTTISVSGKIWFYRPQAKKTKH